VGGHAGATLLAVLSVDLLSRHISERAVASGLISGGAYFALARLRSPSPPPRADGREEGGGGQVEELLAKVGVLFFPFRSM